VTPIRRCVRTTPPSPFIVVHRRAWRRLCRELCRRGEGRRESGAFLLGSVEAVGDGSDRVVREVAYYDDLDARCLTGGITLAGSAFDALWRLCEREQLRVLADIHTHPGSWINQSQIDATNPMMAMPGHVALILGNFAAGRTDPAAIGIHIYQGAHTWQRIDPEQRERVIQLVGVDLTHSCGRCIGLLIAMVRSVRRAWRREAG
jgi:hypothetical protein